MDEISPQLAAGWAVTTVEIVETTTYRVHVAHPCPAPRREIAAAGYQDYCEATHPDVEFSREPGEDQVLVAGERFYPGGSPTWAADRPPHRTVTAILHAHRVGPDSTP